MPKQLVNTAQHRGVPLDTVLTSLAGNLFEKKAVHGLDLLEPFLTEAVAITSGVQPHQQLLRQVHDGRRVPYGGPLLVPGAIIQDYQPKAA